MEGGGGVFSLSLSISLSHSLWQQQWGWYMAADTGRLQGGDGAPLNAAEAALEARLHH